MDIREERGLRASLKANWADAALSIAIPLLLLTCMRLTTCQEAEPCPDAYYHCAMADAPIKEILSTKMPSMTISAWSESFSDKELLFHLALKAARNFLRAAGLDENPPFHADAAIFEMLALVSFSISLRALGMRKTLLPSILFAFAVPFLTARLLLLRPHLLSIAIMSAAPAIFMRMKGWRGIAASAATGAIFSWSYSNPHFILLPALCAAAANFIEERKPLKAALPALACLAGAIGAQILHPQYPNTIGNWYIQCIESTARNLDPGPYKGTPAELIKPDAGELIECVEPLLLLAFAAWILLSKAGGGCKPEERCALLCAGLSVPGMILNLRSLEYGAPYAMMAASLAMQKVMDSKKPQTEEIAARNAQMARMATLLATLLAGATALLSQFKEPAQRAVQPEGLASWIEAGNGPRKDETIANIRWDEYPALRYYLPGYKFLYGIDPLFCRDARLNNRLADLSEMEGWMPPCELAKATGAKWAWLGSPNKHVAKWMELGGYSIAYKGQDGWLFKLPPGTAPAKGTKPE